MSAETFASIFVQEFSDRAMREGTDFAALWHAGGPSWTNLMVHSPDKSSVLERTTTLWADRELVPQSISLHHWYTVDLMAVTPPYQEDYWRCRPVALIEHENRKDVETEVWKLAHWRAPLKVLVFYRFGQSWLDDKLQVLKSIVKTAQSKCPEKDVEYLFLAGYSDNGRVVWLANSWRAPDQDWTQRALATTARVGD